MNKRKKIALVDLLFKFPPDGGARIDILELLKFLSTRYEVKLIFPQVPDNFGRGNIDIKKFPKSLKKNLLPLKLTSNEFVRGVFLVKLIEALKNFAADKVIIGDGWHYKPFLMEALACYSPIVRFYAYEALCLKGHGHRYRNNAICNYCYLKKGSSFQHCLRCFKEWYHKKKTKVFDLDIKASGLPKNHSYPVLVKNGLSAAHSIIVYNRFYAEMLTPFTKRVVVSPGGCNLIKKHYKPYPKEKIFLMAARCDDYLKGLHILIKAVELLVKTGRKDFKVFITHPDKTMQLPPYMENLGWLQQKELQNYIRKSLATIYPSIWPEPFGMAALESAAYGTPVIASDVGGLSDFVRETGAGWLFSPGDYKRLSEIMLALLENPSEATVSDESFSEIKRYNWQDVFTSCYIPLIEQD